MSNNFALFRGEKSADRNKSGLSIAVWSNNQAAILAADHYYYQIFSDIIKVIPKDRKINIVTPHHGGRAGNINKFLGRVTNVNLAVTSTGRNFYGHPKNENRINLLKMGFKLIRTDYAGKDISIHL